MSVANFYRIPSSRQIFHAGEKDQAPQAAVGLRHARRRRTAVPEQQVMIMPSKVS